METIGLIRDFQHRLRGLSDTSGYTFAYDALALMGEYIPCREVGLDIIKPATESPKQAMMQELLTGKTRLI